MVSREQKRAALEEKYQLLRSVTHSNSVNKASILVDASKYVRELKQKVEILEKENNSASSSTSRHHDEDDQAPLVKVRVETLEKGFLIKVYSERSCPGLFVSILEALEEQLGLQVLDATLSCHPSFQLQAIGEESEGGDSLDAQVVRQGVLQAIKNWRTNF